jgi:hypothetical protein
MNIFLIPDDRLKGGHFAPEMGIKNMLHDHFMIGKRI